ncbi:MAG: L-threonylcarbamoyladenylate synthase [Candidatus Delongbacteria bacterium]
MSHAPALELSSALAALECGGVLLLPVDTVPGLAVRADEPAALQALYELKGRPLDKTLSLAFRDLEQVREWLDPPAPQWERLGRLLPGPLTVVLAGSERLGRHWPAWGVSVGLRLPGPCPCSALFARLPWPVALSSANRSGQPTPRRLDEVDPALRCQTAGVWPGECPLGQESTVLDLRTDPPRLLREGALTGPRLAALLEAR